MTTEARPKPILTVFLRGKPEGKKRHRARIGYTADRKPFVSIYPDPDGHAYETAIKWAGKAAMARAGLREPLDCALRLRVTAIFEPPSSWSLKKQGDALADQIRPTGKPDADNCEKVVLDALNKTAWNDDAQIVKIATEKIYGTNPGIYVEVWPWIPPNRLL